MKKDSTDLGIIFFVFLFIFVMLACAGCSTTAHSNKDYIDRYVENAIGQSANKQRATRTQRTEDYNMYLKTRWIGK